jgi:hypothetical protein
MLRQALSFPLMGFAGGIAASAIAGCGSHQCFNDIFSCNATGIALSAPNDSWTPGTYTVTAGGGSASVQCVVSVPAFPSPSGVAGSCAAGSVYNLTLDPVLSCPSVVCDQGACGGMGCMPLAGHFQMTLTIQGLPTQVPVDIAVDGKSLLSETITPTAATTEPNGHGCGTCTNASATASIGS